MDNYSTNSYDEFFYMLLVGLFLSELAVGLVQLLGALIRTIDLVTRKQSIGKLKTYWIIVGIYFFVFACLYFAQHLLLNRISNSYPENSEVFFERFKYLNYFTYAYVVWIFLAWVIAIWYWINIVFVKHKINNSSTL